MRVDRGFENSDRAGRKRQTFQLVWAEPFFSEHLNSISTTNKSFQVSQASNTSWQYTKKLPFKNMLLPQQGIPISPCNQVTKTDIPGHCWDSQDPCHQAAARTAGSVALSRSSHTRIVVMPLDLWSLLFFSSALLFGSLCLVKPQPQKSLVKTFQVIHFFPLKNYSLIRLCCY